MKIKEIGKLKEFVGNIIDDYDNGSISQHHLIDYLVEIYEMLDIPNYENELKKMLKIKEISEIPKFVLDNVNHVLSKDDFIAVYESEGMSGSKPDYLLIIESYLDVENGFQCYGYVYNGNAPECSEFGSFGLNKDETERIW